LIKRERVIEKLKLDVDKLKLRYLTLGNIYIGNNLIMIKGRSTGVTIDEITRAIHTSLRKDFENSYYEAEVSLLFKKKKKKGCFNGIKRYLQRKRK